MIFDGRAMDPLLTPIEKVQAALLATLIGTPEALPRAISFGASEVWFDRPLFEDIWRAIVQLHSEVGCADWITVTRAIETKWTGEGIKTDGLWEEILGVWEYEASIAMVKGYCAQLRAHEASRRAQGILHESLPASSDELAKALLAKATSLTSLADYTRRDGTERINVWDSASEEIEAARKNGTFGVECGITPLDTAFRGWRPGELIVLGARPAVGKSSFAVTVAANFASRNPDAAILYASPEMRVQDIAKRIISCRSGVAATTVESGFCSPENRDRWETATQYMRTTGVEIKHAGMANPQAVYAAAQELKLKRGRLDLVIVDHLHIMRGEGKNDTERMTNISKSILRIAHDLSVPVLALAQLNRQVEHREDPQPSLADLRASGSIEEDGDIVFFLHRPKKTEPTKIQATIAKHRRGECISVNLDFQNSLSRFDWQGPKSAETWTP